MCAYVCTCECACVCACASDHSKSERVLTLWTSQTGVSIREGWSSVTEDTLEVLVCGDPGQYVLVSSGRRDCLGGSSEVPPYRVSG